jgi:hypothetical protein
LLTSQTSEGQSELLVKLFHQQPRQGRRACVRVKAMKAEKSGSLGSDGGGERGRWRER